MSRFITDAPYDAERKRLRLAGESWKICRWCGGGLSGARTAWCSQTCVDEYLIRKSAAVARARVGDRDKGVCAVCGVDTLAIQAYGARLRRIVYGQGDGHWELSPTGSNWYQLYSALFELRPSIVHQQRDKRQDAAHVVECYARLVMEFEWRDAVLGSGDGRVRVLKTWRRWVSFLEARGWTRSRIMDGSEPWDADHIETVHDGGGGCGLDNYQTLCLPCHKRKNAEHARARAKKRSPQCDLFDEDQISKGGEDPPQ